MPKVALHFSGKQQVLKLSHSKTVPMRKFWPLLEDEVKFALVSRQKNFSRKRWHWIWLNTFYLLERSTRKVGFAGYFDSFLGEIKGSSMRLALVYLFFISLIVSFITSKRHLHLYGIVDQVMSEKKGKNSTLSFSILEPKSSEWPHSHLTRKNFCTRPTSRMTATQEQRWTPTLPSLAALPLTFVCPSNSTTYLRRREPCSGENIRRARKRLAVLCIVSSKGVRMRSFEKSQNYWLDHLTSISGQTFLKILNVISTYSTI